MKHGLLTLLLLCCTRLLFAQEYTHLAGNVYVYTTYGHPEPGITYPANGLYIVTDSGIVLIDTSWDDPQTAALVAHLDSVYHQKVVLSISTHCHADRIGGLKALNDLGVNTYTTVRTAQLAPKYGYVQPRFTFTGDTTFRVGHTDIQTFFPGAGHSTDNIVVWLPAQKILFGGCLVKSATATDIGFLGDADLQAWPASIRQLQQHYKNARVVIPGHGPWTGNPLQHTLDMLAALKK